MSMQIQIQVGRICLLAALAASPAFAQAALSAEELAKLAQNPVGDLGGYEFPELTGLQKGATPEHRLDDQDTLDRGVRVELGSPASPRHLL
jgi:hypothetical protein